MTEQKKPASVMDKLIAAAGLEPVKHEFALSTGEVLEFYVTPLTLAESEAVRKRTKGNDNMFAMQLLVEKLKDENGERCFTTADIPVLKRAIKKKDLDKLVALIFDDEESELTEDEEDSF